ncbi:FG-GAP repeat domain-containing protein [Streptomyces pristinaespiralis]|uniref:FG-GAP repeat domain-containing protein n=1 Tax=Streptomyces pristinaespiralis TaxID=38300 RepID=UPI0037B8D187
MESGRPAVARRGRRVATCTALALSAGMLLAAVPAHADDSPAPHAPVERAVPSVEDLRKPTLPRLRSDEPAADSPSFGAEIAVARPRSDVDGDGSSDLLHRAWDGQYWVSASGSADTYQYPLGNSSEMYKDAFSIAGLDPAAPDTPTHFTLSETGRLSSYASTPYGGDLVWSGTGWQQFNKVFSPGDLTGDGVGDVLARNPAGELFLYRAKGGTAVEPFAAKVNVGGGWGQYDQIVGVNDTNGDAIADLFARNTAGELYFYSGTGEPTRPFKERVKVGSGWNAYNQLFSWDDIDGDGLGDLVGRTQAGVLYLYVSTGTGALKPREEGGSGWNYVSQFAGSGNNPAWGKGELIGVDKSGVLYDYVVENDGTFSSRARIGEGWGGSRLSLTSSFDGDGFADLIEVYEGTLYNYNDMAGDGVVGSGWGIYNSLVGPGDLSGDGKGDLIARDSAGVLWLYRGYGTGAGFASRTKIGSGWGQFSVLTGAGDVDGDGRADLIARATDGKLYLYSGTGVASSPFKAKKLVGSGWNTYNKLVAPGDMNGDGRGDLVGRNSDGNLYRYDANGRGGFNAKVLVGSGWNTYNGLF